MVCAAPPSCPSLEIFREDEFVIASEEVPSVFANQSYRVVATMKVPGWREVACHPQLVTLDTPIGLVTVSGFFLRHASR